MAKEQFFYPESADLLKTLDERSEEHTSELQSQSNLVCRLLLDKKKKTEAAQSYGTKRLDYQHSLPADPTTKQYKTKAIRPWFETGEHHVESGGKLTHPLDLHMA